MKSKLRKKIIKIIWIILIMVVVFFLGRKSGMTAEISNTTTTVTEEVVTKRTIQKTLTSSGQVETATSEKLEPSTSKYFKTMCVEDDDTVETGENILEYTDGTYLVAPYRCVVISHSLPETGSKSTSNHYVEIQSLEDLKTTISIDENEISNMAEGQEVEIIPTADNTKIYTGTVSKIDSVGTYQSSGTTFSATILFQNDGALKIGMSISCTILLQEVTDVLTVPIDAVEINDNQKYVVVIKEDGTTNEVEVETGISDEDYVEIKSGLEEGEKVQVTTTTTQSSSGSSSETAQGGRGQGNGQDRMDMGMDRQPGEMPSSGQGIRSEPMQNQ